MCLAVLQLISILCLFIGCLMGFGTLVLTSAHDQNASYIFHITLGFFGTSFLSFLLSLLYKRYEDREQRNRMRMELETIRV